MPRLLAGLLLLLSLAAPARAQDSLLFVIRIDDIQSRSAIDPRGLQPLEAVVEAHGARLSYAVIPGRLTERQNQDGVLAAELRASAARGHEIAMHGLTHICARCGQSSHEMYCTTYDTPFTYAQQQALLRDGRAILEDQTGLRPTAFVPPGHVADATTFEALADDGFDLVSTTEPQATYLHDGLFNVAPQEEFTWALTAADFDVKLADALADIRAADGIYTLLLHDPFTRPGYENGLVLDWMDTLLDSLDAAYGDRITYATLSEASARLQARSVATAPAEAPAAALRLEAAYPNPAADAATFRFTLPAAGAASLRVYDLLGREVAVLVDAVLPAGPHRAAWDAAALPPGVYLARLHAGPAAVARTVTVVR